MSCMRLQEIKIAILTTETTHHCYFVESIKKSFEEVVVFCEKQATDKLPFETRHPFEDDRKKYELERWFENQEVPIMKIAPTHQIQSVNDDRTIELLLREEVDIIIIFGTSILKEKIIKIFSDRLFNLHGGDPEHYRGLDSHLWAIFHKDFSRLVTTLHRLDSGIDTGDIVMQGKIMLAPKTPICAIRALNTEVCVRLATSLIDSISRYGKVTSRPQYAKGRYYSSMPTVLKSVCVSRFNSHVKKLL